MSHNPKVVKQCLKLNKYILPINCYSTVTQLAKSAYTYIK